MDGDIPAARATSEATPATATATATATDKPGARVVFVDVLRLLALFQMINGHTLDAVTPEAGRVGPLYDRYTYLRGLVSVAFMVASGLAYHLATLARFEAHKADPGVRRRRVRRGLVLIAIGYALHYSPGLRSSDPEILERSVATILRVDVLQTIGLSLLLLEAITFVSATVRQARMTALGLALLLVALAPAAAALPVDSSTRWIVNWLGHQGGSLFPILPWGAYVLAGASLGAFLVPDGATARRTAPPRALTASALTALGAWLGYLLWPLPAALHASELGFFFERLAAVLALAAALAFLTRHTRDLPGPFRTLASETLSVYVFHILFLYWTSWGPARLFPHTLSLLPALGVSAAALVLCLGVGVGVPRARPWLGARGRPARSP